MGESPERFTTIEETGYQIKRNGYFADHPERVSFNGRVLVDDHVGFRGRAKVYQTDKGTLVFIYQSNLVPGFVINELPNLEAAARLVNKTFPEFDPELVVEVADRLGVEVPARPLSS